MESLNVSVFGGHPVAFLRQELNVQACSSRERPKMDIERWGSTAYGRFVKSWQWMRAPRGRRGPGSELWGSPQFMVWGSQGKSPRSSQ